jgi:hypothetical protein
LTVDGSRLTRTFKVAPDPRVRIDASAYREQFELARKVEALSARVSVASDSAEKIERVIAKRRAGAAGVLADALDRFQRELREVTGVTPAPNRYDQVAFPRRSIESLGWVGAALRSLAEAVDGADAEPSPDARAGLTNLQPIAARALARWERLVTSGLAALNDTLRAGEAPPIEPGP